MEKKLEVRDLRISFRTNSGTVKAVRDISFDLERGETLAIVGESGSGKSVTAKAILGILARNSIVEGGEIIYDGRDLLKITEEEFNQLRGSRISMIYQDPLSSLDPIMKIGPQMTEATLINGKVAKKRGKKSFSAKCKTLAEAMKAAGVDAAEADAHMKLLGQLLPEASRMRNAYNTAWEYADSAVFSCAQLRTALRKQDEKLIAEETDFLRERVAAAKSPWLVGDEADVLLARLPESLDELEAFLTAATSHAMPDFTALCAVQHAAPAFDAARAEEWNAALRAQADESCLAALRTAVERALAHSWEVYLPKKRAAYDCVKRFQPLFAQEELDVKACRSAINEMNRAVEASIDPLPVVRHAAVCTFASTMNHAIDTYANGVTGNVKELARYQRECARHEKVEKRKADAGKVVPPVLVDLPLTRNAMRKAAADLLAHYEQLPAVAPAAEEADAMLNWLSEQSDAMTAEITKKYAYDKAIRIMEDVGIAEPRKRFEQYPFEFSGGMRQRIVIAIAVAANPDILICDEPTTALDVTIQSQILELINDLKRRRNLTVIFITHDLGVVANIADKVAVMYAGKLVEYGTTEEVFYEPAHPYTWALLSSMPDLDTEERLESIPGTPPNMIYPPAGDAFAERNKYALAIDFEQQPPAFALSPTHWAATWLLHPKAPKVEMPAVVTERIARMKKLEKEAQTNG